MSGSASMVWTLPFTSRSIRAMGACLPWDVAMARLPRPRAPAAVLARICECFQCGEASPRRDTGKHPRDTFSRTDATYGLFFSSFLFFGLLSLLSASSLSFSFAFPLAFRTRPDRGVGGAPGGGILHNTLVYKSFWNFVVPHPHLN